MFRQGDFYFPCLVFLHKIFKLHSLDKLLRALNKFPKVVQTDFLQELNLTKVTMTCRNLMSLVLFLAIGWTGLSCNQTEHARAKAFRTVWVVEPSLVFDACNLIGILVGREIEKMFHGQAHREWYANPPASVQSALVAIDQTIGANWPPGPRLSLLLSQLAEVDGLAQMRALLQNDAEMQTRFRRSAYGSERNWKQWSALKPHVEVVLEYLQSAQFENYWRSRLLPELSHKIANCKQELQAYDVVGDIERFLGDEKFPSDTVTVYLLALAQPHELRLTAQSRYADARLPVRPLVRNFYHEMLYPYCERLVDSLFVEEFQALENDGFLQEYLRAYTGNGGTSHFGEFAKKNVVLAAELWLAQRRQLLAAENSGQQQYGSGEIVRSYLQQKDGGVHVLAAVVYSYLESGLKIERVSYSAFIKDLFATGKLHAGKIKLRYEEFMSGAAHADD